MIGIVQDKREFSDPEAFLALALELGARHVEFKYEERIAEPYGLKKDTPLRLRDLAKEGGISLSVHAPYDQGVSFGDPRREVREKTKQAMEECLDFAHKIEADYITVHGGTVEIEPQHEVKESIGQPDRITLRDKAPKNLFEDLKGQTFQDMAWFIRGGKERGVKIALENFHDFSFFKLRFPILPEDFWECRAALGPDLFVNFDSGHAHSTGIHIVDYINKLGVDMIVGTHLHDNNQLSDEHLSILSGSIDFPSFFEAYRENGWQFTLNVESKAKEKVLDSWQILQGQDLTK